MPVNPPVFLNDKKFLQNSFRFIEGQNKVETTFDSGKSLARKTTLVSPDIFSGTLLLNFSEYTLFREFFKTTLEEGVKEFYWFHPISNRRISVRILDVPNYRNAGADFWNVTFTCEITQEL